MMLIAVAFIGIIGLLISVWIIRQLIKAAKRKFRRFIINLAKKLEPEGINNTRSKIGSNLADIRKNIQSSETDAVRQKLENTYLKDKVRELETAKAALIEELSGSDYTSFEFDLWQQVIETIDFLVNERMRLLGLVDAAVSFSGGSDSSANFEKLVDEVNSLRKSKDSLLADVSRLNSANQVLTQKNLKADDERKELLNLRSARDKLARNLNELNSDYQELTRKFEKANGERKELLDTASTLATKKEELEASQQRVSQLKSLNNSLRQKLEHQTALATRYRQWSQQSIAVGDNNSRDRFPGSKNLRKRIARIRREHQKELALVRLSALHEFEEYLD